MSQATGVDIFRGREREKQILLNLLESGMGPGDPRLGYQAAHARPEPAVALIHGMPGSGKTALATEVAEELKSQHTDADLVLLQANLENSFDLHSADVAMRTLREQIETSPQPAIVLVDGARDSRHLAAVPRLNVRAVIVTSRRDVGEERGMGSLRLGPLDDDAALDMFFDIASRPETDYTPEELVGIVNAIDVCDRVPLAVQAAARLLCEGACPAERLSGRLVDDGVDPGFLGEYRLLPLDEQLAFALLSQVTSPTFGPWVIAVMQEVTIQKAREICGSLDRAQLIEPVMFNAHPNRPRYRLHPLARVLAERLLKREHARRVDATRRLLDAAYRELVEAASAPADALRPSRALLTDSDDLISHVREHLDEFARAEYGEIARVQAQAHRAHEWGLSRRIGVVLGGIVPTGPAIDDIDVIIHQTIEAAVNDDEADVLERADAYLAAAATRTALENYPEVENMLREASRLLDGLPEDNQTQLRRGRVHQRRAEGLVQMRHPRLAERELDAASDIFGRLPARREQALVALQRHLLRDTGLPDREDFGQLIVDVGPTDEFWVVLQRFEQIRRKAEWAEARAHLDWADTLARDDARRQANLLYRDARLYIDEWKRTPDDLRDSDLVRYSVRRGFEAIARFQRMGNVLGELRTYFRVVQALIEAGEKATAHAYLSPARAQLKEMKSSAGSAYLPLHGRSQFTHALYLRAVGDYSQAHDDMSEAINVFREIRDDRSTRDARRAFAEWKQQPPEIPSAPARVGAGIERGPRFDAALDHIHEYVTGRRNRKAPSCFISYAWHDHANWVRHSFAADLARAGLDVIIDDADQSESSLARFIARLPTADYVVVIGTPEYKRRYHADDEEHNVKVEVDLFFSRLSGEARAIRSVVRVLVEGNPEDAFPTIMPSPKQIFDFRYQDLYVPQLLALLAYALEIPPDDQLWGEIRSRLGT